ncbi:NAD(+) kinase, partial [Bacillus cereus]|nr:NAD(+) kinase [Bacillus cereus]
MKFTLMSKGDRSSATLASTIKECLPDLGFIM